MCYQEWTKPLSPEPFFAYMSPGPDNFSIEIVCTRLNSRKENSCLVLSVFFSLWRVQVWLRFRKIWNQKVELYSFRLSAKFVLFWQQKLKQKTHCISLVLSHTKAENKVICMAPCCKISLLLNLAALSLCLSSSLVVEIIHAFFGFLSALHVPLSLLLSPSSACCGQGASLGRGMSS